MPCHHRASPTCNSAALMLLDREKHAQNPHVLGHSATSLPMHRLCCEVSEDSTPGIVYAGGTPMLLDENTPHPGNAATSARRNGRGGASKPAGGSTNASRCLTCFTMPATSLLSGLLEGGEGAGEADLKSLLHAARRRCGDEKGQVRNWLSCVFPNYC